MDFIETNLMIESKETFIETEEIERTKGTNLFSIPIEQGKNLWKKLMPNKISER